MAHRQGRVGGCLYCSACINFTELGTLDQVMSHLGPDIATEGTDVFRLLRWEGWPDSTASVVSTKTTARCRQNLDCGTSGRAMQTVGMSDAPGALLAVWTGTMLAGP
jgi:hypothetical protein